MNCYAHDTTPAVSTCSAGCGRGLCTDCTGEFEPPTCQICAESIVENQAATEALQHSELRTLLDTEIRHSAIRIAVSGVALLAYVAILNLQLGSEALNFLVPIILVYGYLGYRWLRFAVKQGYMMATRSDFIIETGSIPLLTFLGTFLIAGIGFLVAPILILYHFVRMSKLRSARSATF